MIALMIDKLSVFLPFYNEEGNVEPVTLKTKRVLEKNFKTWELILINDGSKDTSGEIIARLAAKDKRLIPVQHPKNRGYGGALKSGYSTARYPWVAFMDADGQFDFTEITDFVTAQERTGADLVLGIRHHRADSMLRQLFTFVWSKLLPQLIFGLKVTDYSCGFKLIRKSVYEKSLPLVGEEKVTQIELLVKAQRQGFKFNEINVHHYPRQAGQQTGANFKVVFKSLFDLIKLWSQLRK